MQGTSASRNNRLSRIARVNEPAPPCKALSTRVSFSQIPNRLSRNDGLDLDQGFARNKLLSASREGGWRSNGYEKAECTRYRCCRGPLMLRASHAPLVAGEDTFVVGRYCGCESRTALNSDERCRRESARES